MVPKPRWDESAGTREPDRGFTVVHPWMRHFCTLHGWDDTRPCVHCAADGPTPRGPAQARDHRRRCRATPATSRTLYTPDGPPAPAPPPPHGPAKSSPPRSRSAGRASLTSGSTFGTDREQRPVVRIEWEASALHVGPLAAPRHRGGAGADGVAPRIRAVTWARFEGQPDRLVARPLGGRRPGVVIAGSWYPIGYHEAMDAAATLRRVRPRSGLTLRALAARADTSHATLLGLRGGPEGAHRRDPRPHRPRRGLRARGRAHSRGRRRRPHRDGSRAARGARARRAVPGSPRMPSSSFPASRGVVTTLVDKIVALHESLDAAEIPHAFGGALALAWCTQRARGTIDIDVNVFVDRSRTRRAAGRAARRRALVRRRPHAHRARRSGAAVVGRDPGRRVREHHRVP